MRNALVSDTDDLIRKHSPFVMMRPTEESNNGNIDPRTSEFDASGRGIISGHMLAYLALSLIKPFEIR
jgi:hypothetical protein